MDRVAITWPGSNLLCRATVCMIQVTRLAMANTALIRNGTLVLGSIVAYFLLRVGPSYTLVGSSVLLLLGFIPVFMIPENRGDTDKTSYAEFLLSVWEIVKRNRNLRYLLSSYFFFGITLSSFLFSWQRELIENGLSEKMFAPEHGRTSWERARAG